MEFLKRIQRLPESKKKIILWIAIIIIGFGLLNFWAKNLQQKLKSFKMEEWKKELNLPSLKELKEIPKTEIPK